MENLFESSRDYDLALLELLENLGGSGDARDVCQRFGDEYQTNIPQGHYEELPSGVVRWEKKVHFSRLRLKTKGLLDESHRGMWILSQAGRQWLEQYKTESWEVKRDAPWMEGALAPPYKKRKAPNSGKPLLSYEELVEVKKHLPSDKFDQIFGSAWEAAQRQRMAQLVTRMDERKLVTLVRENVRHIQDIVLGKVNTPSDAELCGLVEFCYQMELFREGTALFQRIEPNSVDEAIYSRAKKIAETCRLKLQVD